MTNNMPDIQAEIAGAISPLFTHIDLTIPAQRQIANEVRKELGLGPLSAISPGILRAAVRIEPGPPVSPDPEPTMKAAQLASHRGEQ